MGKLIGASPATNVDFFVDFENPKASEQESDLNDKLSVVLDRSPIILDKLLRYSGCEEYIRKAITSPGNETEEAAWNAVLPAVDQLQEFFNYALELEGIFPKLLTALCKDTTKSSIQNQQALAKQLASIFDFVLRFDDAKMTNPAIQNDFSYYRRTLNRMKISKKEMNISIRDELANRMSLFFAYPTPMMKVIGDSTTKFLSSADCTVPRENVSAALGLMANVCQQMVFNKKFASDATNMFCLRAMSGAIILFDHIDAQGAFTKKSGINIRGCVNVLKSYTTSPTDGLLNALRFTTIHLNDPQTPNQIKQLLNS